MTKKIRIMNADTADYNVIVEVWTKCIDGSEELVETKEINHPADMLEIMIWTGRKIVIRENGNSDHLYHRKPHHATN